MSELQHSASTAHPGALHLPYLLGGMHALFRSRVQDLFIHDAAARLSNDTDKERLDQVRRSLDRLDTVLLRLDENLMFFNTF